MHFVLSFKRHVLSAWKSSVRPKYVACIDGTNNINYG